MIKVTPDRVCDICDAFLWELHRMEPEIDAVCKPIEDLDAAINERQLEEWSADVKAWNAKREETKEARVRWRNACSLFRGPEPELFFYPPPHRPWPISSSPRWGILAVKHKVEEMRARGRLACEPFDITAEEAISLDRWESGEELERVRKLISVAVTQE